MAKMAIYLLKRPTSVMNREIGELFHGLTCSSISKANQMLTVVMAGDRSLSFSLTVEEASGA